MKGRRGVNTEDSPDLRRRLGNRIRATRDELGLSQQELADRAGVGVNTIIRMERGELAQKRSTTWAKIETALNWPGGYFDDYLAGDVSEDVEARYRRHPIPEGKLVGLVESMI